MARIGVLQPEDTRRDSEGSLGLFFPLSDSLSLMKPHLIYLLKGIKKKENPKTETKPGHSLKPFLFSLIH